MTRTGPLIAALVAAGAVTGCILVTGDSTGYSSASGAVSGETCMSASDCNGLLCCIVLSDAGVPSTTCQASCTAAYEQLCNVASDCGVAGECVSQSCTIEGLTATVATCGAIPICTQ